MAVNMSALQIPSLSGGTGNNQVTYSGFNEDEFDNNLLNLFQQISGSGGGLVGNLLTGGALSAGATLLSGIGDLIGGPSKQEKGANRIFNLAQNRLGQSVFDPSLVLSKIMASMRPQMTKQAEQITRRLGLDAGVAAGELANINFPTLLRLGAELDIQNRQLSSARDLSLLQIMNQANLSR